MNIARNVNLLILFAITVEHRGASETSVLLVRLVMFLIFHLAYELPMCIDN